MLSWLGNSVFVAIAFVLVFGVIVLIHELGHFIMARRHGVKVLEFGFGMPPRIWGYQKGDTLYSINWIPVGGFVRTNGQNDFGTSAHDQHDPTSFLNKTAWQRAQIIGAGVVMNILLAFVLLAGGYMVGMQPLLETTPRYSEALVPKGVYVQQISPDGAAAQSSLAPGDIITGADNQPILSNDDLSAYAQTRAGTTITLQVQRSESIVDVPVLVDSASGRIGVSIQNVADILALRYGPLAAMHAATLDIYHVSVMTFQGLVGLVQGIFTSLSLSSDVTGPVGIIKITADVVQMGFSRTVQLAAILSITLAVLNVMPFPGLDGGHLAFLALEKIRGKRLAAAAEARIHMIGFALLFMLLIAVTIKDIQRF